VGRPGRRILSEKLKGLIEQRNIDCVIANAENAAGGSGLTQQIHTKLLRYGVNLVTLGDHAYRKKDIVQTLESEDSIVRPANLSEFAAGKGVVLSNGANEVTVTSWNKFILNTYFQANLWKPAGSPLTPAPIIDLTDSVNGNTLAAGKFAPGIVSELLLSCAFDASYIDGIIAPLIRPVIFLFSDNVDVLNTISFSIGYCGLVNGDVLPGFVYTYTTQVPSSPPGQFKIMHFGMPQPSNMDYLHLFHAFSIRRNLDLNPGNIYFLGMLLNPLQYA
jgi:hypothetical protein